MTLDPIPARVERAASPIQTMVSTSPLPKPQPLTRYLEGITLAQMADRGGIERGTWAAYRATITIGLQSWDIPAQHWTVTKPHGGAIVEIVPLVHGPAVAAIGSALITSFAPTIAASIFGTGLLATLATAAISIVGTLALNSLIQPPEPEIGDTTPFYGIGAPANRVERYAPVAYPVGRHLSYPQPAATGYSETREDTVIY
ncbi:hypothetical protein AAD018_011540, partial [Aestuariibius insulae]|uniref:hypothetical protein n=1 Tax=Aestuariibius insulae TaxID=2058287 RepID=UPI00398E37D7